MKLIPRNIIIWTAVLLPFSAAAMHNAAACAFLVSAFLILLAMAVLDFLFLSRSMRKISVEAPEISRFSLLHESQIDFRLLNTGDSPATVRFAALMPSAFKNVETDFQTVVPGASMVKAGWRCIPQERGLVSSLRCIVEMNSMIGLWTGRADRNVATEIRIYPDIHSERKGLAAYLLNRNFYGVHVFKMFGQGREFDKLRDYIHGDSYNIISWKATARKSVPVSKVFQVERTQEIYAIMDTGRFSGRTTGGCAVIERYLSSALVLGLAAERQGDLFGLMSFDKKVENFVRARNGKTHYNSCREAVFRLKPKPVSPDYHALFSFIRTRLRRRAMLVFLTDLDDSVLAESFAEGIGLISRQHLCLVLSPSAPAAGPMFEGEPVKSVDEIYGRLANHMNWADMMILKNNLSKRGVHFQLVKPDDLGRSAIAAYLQIKERQLI
ncbi:MAG TPA: DUF58 domain-containing protein [Lentisphaeria bacterium]|nr:MAG: hypothetical protein A2X48_05445 [Lentisphaerae bacterium GWF2_49_21]HBC86143.1 DUF58 domain-containing protein [Lentisphaeria bacterium]